MYDKRCAKELFCGVYSPKRKVVEFTVKLRNTPGALFKVSKLIANLNINIISGFYTAQLAQGDAIWSFFADLTEAKIPAKSLAERIRRLNVVLDVDFSEREFSGLFIDELHFPLIILGDRGVVFRIETVAEIFRKLKDAFGSGAALIIYTMGVNAGKNEVESVSARYGASGLTAIRIIMAERAAKGWCIPEIKEFDEEKLEARIEAEDLFECLPRKGMEKVPQSLFFKGYLEGIFSKLFNREFRVEERECIAKGDQKCTFIIKQAL
ncbi:MAG: V4R domain-containing protein [Candidatus Nezhaarchaeales archaeon]